MPLTPKVRDWDNESPIKTHGEQAHGQMQGSFKKLVHSVAADAIPNVFIIGATLALIFGGCCSNVSPFVQPLVVYAGHLRCRKEPNVALFADALGLQVYSLEAIIQ